MKTLRVAVLLLIALLLPIRGAVAATMVCAEMGGAAGRMPAAAHAHQGVPMDGAAAMEAHHHGDAQAHGAPHTHAAPDAPGAASSDSASSDTCHICASGCGLAALLTALPAPLGALPAALARFPSVAVPALDFQLDGQDRPPRTL